MTMTHLYVLIAFVAYAGAALRLLAYRKDGARHRHHVSWIAWALLVIEAGSAINVLLHAHPIDFFEVARAVAFTVFIFGSRGNVARLLRSE
jgi:hypothetical protein